MTDMCAAVVAAAEQEAAAASTIETIPRIVADK